MDDKKSLPERKLPRLKNYDYSRSGAYFVTICTKDRREILSKIIVGKAAPCREPQNLDKLGSGNPVCLPLEECMIFNKLELTDIGGIVEKHIMNIEKSYEAVKVSNYVIMPNHIHLLLIIDSRGMQRAAFPTEVKPISVSEIVKSLKSLVARDVKEKIFQSSFHDHIIRNKESYIKIWHYIENNSKTWFNDCFYRNANH